MPPTMQRARETFWRILLSVDTVFHQFRAGFTGKASPVHFFWGSFDLAVTRFSGRRAPERPGADRITREAYSHEVSSVGFWPGTGAMTGPAFLFLRRSRAAGILGRRVRPLRLASMRASESFCSSSTTCVPPLRQAQRCSRFARAPMTPLPRLANGIGSCWSR